MFLSFTLDLDFCHIFCVSKSTFPPGSLLRVCDDCLDVIPPDVSIVTPGPPVASLVTGPHYEESIMGSIPACPAHISHLNTLKFAGFWGAFLTKMMVDAES